MHGMENLPKDRLHQSVGCAVRRGLGGIGAPWAYAHNVIQHRSAEVCSGEIGAGEVGAGEVRLAKRCAAEVCSGYCAEQVTIETPFE